MGNRPTDVLAGVAMRYVNEDYTNLKAVGAFIKDCNVKFLIPGCTDSSYESCCNLATHSVFPGYESPAALLKLHRKDKFRALCRQLAISVPRVFETIDEALASSSAVIVKPTDSFSGKGITVLSAPTREALEVAVADASKHSASDSAVIEEFVYGDLHSYSAFLRDGRVQVAFSVAEFCSVNPFVVDTSYVLETNSLEEPLRRDVEKLAAELGIESGLFHVQYITHKERYYLIEATRRCPGDLYSQLISLSSGYPYALAYTSNFIGRSLPPATSERHRYVVRHTVTGGISGILKSVAFNNPADIKQWYPLMTVGETIHPSPAGRVGVGFFEKNNLDETEKLVSDLINGRMFSLEYEADPRASA